MAVALLAAGTAQAQTTRDPNGPRVPDPPAPINLHPIQESLRQLSRDRINQLVTTRVLGGILLGTTQQVSCGNCFSAFGAVGSASGGVHGRYNVTDEIAILGGASANSFRERGADVKIAPILALSVRYDPADMGPSRPFFEAGGFLSPEAAITYTRPYGSPAVVGNGRGDTSATSGAGFVRAGWVARLSPRDEVAVAADLSHGFQRVGGYAERGGFGNALPARFAAGTDTINVARFGGQYTRLVTDRIEVNVTAGLGYAFEMRSGVEAAISSVGPLGRTRLPDTPFFEGGARIGYRLTENSVIDTFVVTAAGAQPVGSNVHGGVGWRTQF